MYGELFLIKSVNETNINHTNTQNLWLVIFNMFMNDPAINKLVDDLSQGNDIHSA